MPGFGISKQCTHILVTGHRCGSPALRGQFLCFFHARLLGRVSGRIDSTDCMTHLESQDSIQFALMSLLSRALLGTIDLPRANFALKLLNTAVRNARLTRFSRNADDMVTSLPNYADQYLTEHPEHADPARKAARKAAAAKGLAARRANQAIREAKRVQRAAQRAARKNTSGTNTPVPETPPEVSPANHAANTVTPESRPKSADAPNPHPTAIPDRKPAHSSPNGANPNRIPARLNRRSGADELHKQIGRAHV